MTTILDSTDRSAQIGGNLLGNPVVTFRDSPFEIPEQSSSSTPRIVLDKMLKVSTRLAEYTEIKNQLRVSRDQVSE